MADVTNYTIENASGANVRIDLNNVFGAIQSSNSKSTDLSSSQCVAGMFFVNTTSNTLKIRNSSNNAFTDIGNINTANLGLLPVSGGTMTGQLLADDGGTAAAPAISFDGDSDTGLFRSAANEVAISTTGTERWTFISDGSLITHARGIGDSLTTQGATFYVNGSNFNGLALVKNEYNWGTPLFIQLLNASGQRNILEIQYNTGSSGTGTAVGGISCNASSTTFSTSSDYRLKENVVPISDGITRLKTLKPYKFNFKVDTSTTVDGFFAHEVTAVPEAITGTKDEVEPEDNNMRNVKKGDPIYQTIDQSKLVPLVVAALQEAVAKIETLETKVAALEGS